MAFLMWLIIVWWQIYSDIIISNKFVHFHHCFFYHIFAIFCEIEMYIELKSSIKNIVEATKRKEKATSQILRVS